MRHLIMAASVLSTGSAYAVSGSVSADNGGPPVSEYFVVSGDAARIDVLQSDTINLTWATTYGCESPLAVASTVRTLSNSSPPPLPLTGCSEGPLGGEYTLDGDPTGNTYEYPGFTAWDSTTDGEHNYLVDFDGSGVYMTNADYSNPTLMFGLADGWLGITYDPTNNSLWLSAFAGGDVINVDMAGTTLSSFNTGLGQQAALALDHADGTLWLVESTQNGDFFQFDKSGNLLSTQHYSGLVGVSPLGGEFAITPKVHLLAVGIEDNSLGFPMHGDLSAIKVRDAFGALSQIDLATSELGTFEFDSDNPEDGFENKLAINALIDGMIAPDGPVRPGDTFIFYIATHGSYFGPAGRGGEVFVCQQTNPFLPFLCNQRDTDELLILGADGHYYTDDDLRAKFDSEAWNDVNKVFIVDSCFAGGFWGTSIGGDSGDFRTLPRSAIIAACIEERFSYGANSGHTYLSLVIEQALSTLKDEEEIAYAEITQAIMDATTWLLDEYTDKNGEFNGIILGGGDPVDFSEFWGETVEAEFAPMFAQTDDFSFIPGEVPCPWDLDGDNVVGTGDLIVLLGSWGDPYGTADLIELLGNWGPCP